MRHLKLSSGAPYVLLAGEGFQRHRIQGPSNLDGRGLVLEVLICITQQCGLLILLIDVVACDGAYKGPACGRVPGPLRLLCIAQPGVSVDDDTHLLQSLDGPANDLVRHLSIAVGLFQLSSSNPDALLSRQGLARAVQHLLCILIRFQLRQSQPELGLVRTALHGAVKHHLGILFIHQLDGMLPQRHRVRHALQGFLQHAQLCGLVCFQRSCCCPQPCGVRYLRHASREHCLGILSVLLGIQAAAL
mmetsp:Transcript_21497/g.59523  ORF Transcript_21497/g.59523 Transcript_21497/m.59523 type:complete len:246 (-) Transcript_21497:1106-1843(-)